MTYALRQAQYHQIEADRKSKVLAFVTGDRIGLETRIATDAIAPFVSILDAIGPTKKLSLILDTNGGQTSAAWRLIKLLRSFCDELEVLVPTKAMSAGTLMALGADNIVMTKQASLGPIDPSLDNHPLGPKTQGGYSFPVSAEAVRGYIDEIKKDVTDPAAMAQVWIHLSAQIHPLVLGQVFRLGGQIRSMAKTLIAKQVPDQSRQDEIIQLLCSDSGSHDYTIDRRAARDLGLKIETPTVDLYGKLSELTKLYHLELKTFEPFSYEAIIGAAPQQSYALVRGLIESADNTCYGYVTEGNLVRAPAVGAGPVGLSNTQLFEGWKKL